MRTQFTIAVVAVICIVGIRPVAAQGTAFTYQGRITFNGAPANGVYDFDFGLYNTASGGSLLGSADFVLNVPVTNGLFTVSLDFGANFTGAARWLEIAVRTNVGGTLFTLLMPRQPITPAPYAITAASAVEAKGNFTIENNLNLPRMTATNGLVYSGTNLLLHGDETSQDFFVGPSAGNLSVIGGFNTGVGWQALHAVTFGAGNTAVGYTALYSNTIGNFNTAVGFQALYTQPSSGDGDDNTAVGAYALQNNAGGFNNTGLGSGALHYNSTGGNNTGVGSGALDNNVTGYANTAVGVQSLWKGTNNIENTAVGWQALLNNTRGTNNVAIGFQAGDNLTTGDNNICIGNEGFAGNENTIRIGKQNVQTNTHIAGIYGTTVSGGVAVYVTSSAQLGVLPSSARFKEDIQSMDGASEVLLSLHPVTFRYKSEIDPQGIPQFGLVAEEVNKVDPDLVVHDEAHGIYSVRYEAVNAMLLNEFLRQHRKVEEQNAKICDLESRLAKLEALISLAVAKTETSTK